MVEFEGRWGYTMACERFELPLLAVYTCMNACVLRVCIEYRERERGVSIRQGCH